MCCEKWVTAIFCRIPMDVLQNNQGFDDGIVYTNQVAIQVNPLPLQLRIQVVQLAIIYLKTQFQLL